MKISLFFVVSFEEIFVVFFRTIEKAGQYLRRSLLEIDWKKDRGVAL